MCKEIKCPKFLSKTNGHFCYKLRSKIVDKKSRKVHLIKFCCGNYSKCKLCKEC